MPSAAIALRQARTSKNLLALADEKGSLFWKANGMIDQGCVLVLTGKASDAIEMIDLRDCCISGNGSNTLDAISFVAFGESPCGTWAIR